MDQYLTKYTAEAVTYTLDCAGILATGETITAVTSVTSDQAGLAIGASSVNTQPLTFPDGTGNAIGTAILIPISGGTIPAAQDDMGLGVPNLLCTIRAIFTTSAGNTREGVLPLLLKDQVSF